METLGVKIAVFGIGKVGLMLIDKLSKPQPPNTEFIALDTERTRLEALDGKVRKLALVGALENTPDGGKLRSAINERLLDSMKEFPKSGIVIILASASSDGEFGIIKSVSELCKGLGITTVVLYIKDLSKASVKNPSRGLDTLLPVSDAVVLSYGPVDATGSLPLDALTEAESVARSLIYSVSGIGFVTQDAGEIKRSLQGGLFFCISDGVGTGFSEAFDDAFAKAEESLAGQHVERVFAITYSQSEPELDELRRSNDVILNRLGVGGVVWAQLQSQKAETEVLLLCGVKELPGLVSESRSEAASANATIVKEPDNATIVKKDNAAIVEEPESTAKEDAMPVTPEVSAPPIMKLWKEDLMAASAEKPSAISIWKNKPIVSDNETNKPADSKSSNITKPTDTKLSDMGNTTPPANSSVIQNRRIMGIPPARASQPEGPLPSIWRPATRVPPKENLDAEDIASDLEEFDSGAEIRPSGISSRPETKASLPEEPWEQSTIDVPIPVDDLLETEITNKTPAPSLRLKNQALIGMHDRPEEKQVTMPNNPKLAQLRNLPADNKEVSVDDDLDDVISELTGMPSFKSKGQKKLQDYRGEYGIGWA